MNFINQIAQQFLTDANADGKVDINDAVGSFKNLLSNAEGKLDISSLTSKMPDIGLSDTLSSWLGDGSNLPISKDDITKLFDTDKLTQFASSLNLDLDSVKNGLANTVPNVIDKISAGGKLLDTATDLMSQEAGDLLGKVKNIFGN